MRNLKLILLGVLTMVYSKSMLAQNLSTDSTFTYNENRQKEWHYMQKDVYCFKLKDEAKYTGQEHFSNGIVDTILYWKDVTSKFNEVHFNKNSTLIERESTINEIQSLPNFVIGSFALTKTPNLSYDSSKYFPTDDRILITFKNKRIDKNTISNFARKYHLELLYSPLSSLPKDLYWPYTFRFNPHNKQLTSIQLAQLLVKNESNLIKIAEPNIYSVTPLDCITKNEMSSVFDGNYSTWHIRNTGQENILNNQYGTNDADADICECWGEGYTGKNIKVGVIDFGGVQFSHPDFDDSKIYDTY